MEQQEFEQLVNEGITDLPKHIRNKVDNVAVCVAEKPTADQIKRAKIGPGRLLLGLYEGVPKTAWGRGFGGNLPDKITIFQDSIEQVARTPEAIRKQVKKTVWHEVAHHFGFSESGVRGMERGE